MKRNEIIHDINSVLEQIKEWVEIKSCRCSYYPVRNLLEAALNGEIWEQYRLLKNATWKTKEDLIENLADLVLKK